MSCLVSKTAEKLEKALLKAQARERSARQKARLSSIVFWGLTVLLFGVACRDVASFFASSSGVRLMALWTLPAAWYIVSSRLAGQAAQDLSKLKNTAISRGYPGLCPHENPCGCRQDFFDKMEKQGIDLYL
ncbi:MAG: hypothetical protein GXY92_06735 [Syntrophomonadaceae bacterium]|nr:hypothetical protein [Syntrophomonadaceae bacterium]